MIANGTFIFQTIVLTSNLSLPFLYVVENAVCEKKKILNFTLQINFGLYNYLPLYYGLTWVFII